MTIVEETFSTRKLLSGAELKEFNAKSDIFGGLQMASHLALIGGLGYLQYLAMGSWWVLASGFALGVVINFLYAAQHELSHWTVFRTRYLNELFGRLVGFAMIFPRDYDLVMHQAHHRWTSNWERDGELTRAPYTLQSYSLYFIGITYWMNRVTGLVRRARGIIIEPYIGAAVEAKIIRESRLHIAGYAVIALVSLALESWAAVAFADGPDEMGPPASEHHRASRTVA